MYGIHQPPQPCRRSLTTTTAYQIVGIPERARPNSSKVDTRPRIALRPPTPPAWPPTRAPHQPPLYRSSRRSRRLRLRMGNRKTNPLGQIPVPGFCGARVYMTSVSSCGSRRCRVCVRVSVCVCERARLSVRRVVVIIVSYRDEECRSSELL